jgi:pimeloyl-ACP methyl ester carboxylesterase
MSEEWKDVRFEARSASGFLCGRYNLLGADALRPVVMMLTGDGPKGSKSASWTNLPPMLAAVGIRSFLFDFEGLGFSDGERRNLTLTRGIENLEAAFKCLKTEVAPIDISLGAIASSYGAAALLRTPSIANQFKGIALKSPAPFLAEAYYNEIGGAEFRSWAQLGYSTANGYDFGVLQDCLSHNVWQSTREITSPVLITHGTSDEIVPYAQSEILAACLAGETELDTFEGVGHGYSEPGAWDRMARKIVAWLRNKLV